MIKSMVSVMEEPREINRAMVMEELREINRVFARRSGSANGRLYRISRRMEIPFLAVKKGTKYGTLEYDMWTTDYILKPEPLERLKSLKDEMIAENCARPEAKKFMWIVMCHSSGMVHNVLIDIAVKYLPLFEKIILDERNWLLFESRY